MRATFLVVLILAATSPAWAQNEAAMEKARQRFEAGSQAFSQGDYAKAEADFAAAYAITKDSLLLFNIAQAQQGRGHLKDAISSYQAYLAGVPDAEDRREVQSTIRRLERELAVPKPEIAPAPVVPPAAAPVAPLPPTPEESRAARRQAAWLTCDAAAVLVGVGVAMAIMSSSKAQDANQLQDQRDASGQPLPFTQISDQYNRYKRNAEIYGGVAIGTFAAAGVGAALATYLFLTSSSPASSEPTEARWRFIPSVSTQGAGLVAGLEF